MHVYLLTDKFIEYLHISSLSAYLVFDEHPELEALTEHFPDDVLVKHCTQVWVHAQRCHKIKTALDLLP